MASSRPSLSSYALSLKWSMGSEAGRSCEVASLTMKSSLRVTTQAVHPRACRAEEVSVKAP
jgi:hypothetical protein